MGKMRPSGSFDSAPLSAVSRDKSVTRSAQDDDFVVSWRCKKSEGMEPAYYFKGNGSALSDPSRCLSKI
jgi:hypothetical protein